MTAAFLLLLLQPAWWELGAWCWELGAGSCCPWAGGARCSSVPLSPPVPRPQEQPELRHSSIVLFGHLSRFSHGHCEVFFEQILNGLVTLLLHLQDPQPDVVNVSTP